MPAWEGLDLRTRVATAVDAEVVGSDCRWAGRKKGWRWWGSKGLADWNRERSGSWWLLVDAECFGRGREAVAIGETRTNVLLDADVLGGHEATIRLENSAIAHH